MSLKPSLVLALGLSACAVAFAEPSHPTAAEVAADQQAVVDHMGAPYGVDPLVVWVPCGYENAFYLPDADIITLCLEMNEAGPLMAAAHEMGHALRYDLGLEIDSDPWADERAADELGALALIEMGNLDAVVSGAKWFMDMGSRDWDPNDPHPPDMARARELLCLVDGAEGKSVGCIALYRAVKTRWELELKPHLLPEFPTLTLDWPE